MAFIKRTTDDLGSKYPIVEAMYYRGSSTEEIARAIGCQRWQATDLIQRCFHRDQMKRRTQVSKENDI